MRGVEAVKQPISYADLQRMPDDGNRYELYDGKLWVVPAPFSKHQTISKRLFRAVDAIAIASGGEAFYAPFDIVFSEYNVVQPDLIYFGPESARRIPADAAVRFPPDAAFEVLSPSTARNDRGRKRRLMARYGVPEYWVIDPDGRHVEISRWSDGGYGEPLIIRSGPCASSVIPGLEIDLSELFDGFE